MGTKKKFSSKMDANVLDRLRAHAKREGRTLSSILTTAVEQYLRRVTLRPAFREVLEDHAEVLERLAR